MQKGSIAMIRFKHAIWVILFIFISQNVLADCDWSKIKDNGNGTYTYSEDLHKCVGNLVKDNQTKDQQISDYTRAIQLKDLAIKASDDRADKWMDNSLKVESKLSEVDSLQKKNEWLMFGLGALTVIGAGYMASKLIHP